MDSKDRDEAILEMFQDFHENPLNDEAVERLRKGLRKFYPDVVWKDKYIAALRGPIWKRRERNDGVAGKTRHERLGQVLVED